MADDLSQCSTCASVFQLCNSCGFDNGLPQKHVTRLYHDLTSRHPALTSRLLASTATAFQTCAVEANCDMLTISCQRARGLI